MSKRKYFRHSEKLSSKRGKYVSYVRNTPQEETFDVKEIPLMSNESSFREDEDYIKDIKKQKDRITLGTKVKSIDNKSWIIGILVAVILGLIGYSLFYTFSNMSQLEIVKNDLGYLSRDIERINYEQENNFDDVYNSLEGVKGNDKKILEIENKINILEIEIKKDIENIKDKINIILGDSIK
jgi:hypothetical protein